MSDTIQSVKDLPEVSFIDNDTLEAMKTRMVANFESEWKRITGQEITLSPSDPNRIMLYAIALELYQDEQYIDRAGKQFVSVHSVLGAECPHIYIGFPCGDFLVSYCGEVVEVAVRDLCSFRYAYGCRPLL